MLTPEELLKPRVRCKGDGEYHFPGSCFKPGEILDVAHDGARLVSPKTGNYVDWLKYKKYPHLFEEVQWWEDRKPEDMPEYVKDNKGIIRKVDRWLWDEDSEVKNSLYCELSKPVGGHIDWYPHTFGFLPATETEYLNHKNKSNA